MIRVLIIEDELRTARELSDMVLSSGRGMQVLAIIDTVESAIDWLSANEHPDLIISDIQLADGLSFEIFRQLKPKSALIFCTAYDEYLLRAFDTNAVSYILKPLSQENLEKAFSKYMDFRSVFEADKETVKLEQLLNHLKLTYKKTILVYAGEKIIPLPVSEILCFYLDNSLLSIYTEGNKVYRMSSTLDEVEKVLDPGLFFRANRQFLVSRNAILMAERYFARKIMLRLKVEVPEQILISKARAADFLLWMEQ